MRLEISPVEVQKIRDSIAEGVEKVVKPSLAEVKRNEEKLKAQSSNIKIKLNTRS